MAASINTIASGTTLSLQMKLQRQPAHLDDVAVLQVSTGAQRFTVDTGFTLHRRGGVALPLARDRESELRLEPALQTHARGVGLSYERGVCLQVVPPLIRAALHPTHHPH